MNWLWNFKTRVLYLFNGRYCFQVVLMSKYNGIFIFIIKWNLLIFTEGVGTLNCLLHQSPKFHNTVFLFVESTTSGTYIRIWLVCLISVQTFQPLIEIPRDNFVYHYWVCTPIYQPLFYPFRSLWYSYV